MPYALLGINFVELNSFHFNRNYFNSLENEFYFFENYVKLK